MNYIIGGVDLHDNSLVVKVARNIEKPVKLSFPNTGAGRLAFIRSLKARARAAGGAGVVAAYEASCQGFGLYDDAGEKCFVLAPTEMERSTSEANSKNDERDAGRILQILRAHLLAGNDLPSIWVPDKKTRDDREVVRARLDIASKATAVKAQVQMLLKRSGVRMPKGIKNRWTRMYRAWLKGLVGSSALKFCAACALAALLRQLEFLESEIKTFDSLVEAMSEEERYAEPVREMTKQTGVGILVAMVYLTELGDLSRFKGRKQIGSYVGLAPRCRESGEAGDRKGHITHQGPERVRKMLCQAVWTRVRFDSAEKARYDRQVKRNPKHKKIAIVAAMRRLAVLLWHKGLEAQTRAGVFARAAKAPAPAR